MYVCLQPTSVYVGMFGALERVCMFEGRKGVCMYASALKRVCMFEV